MKWRPWVELRKGPRGTCYRVLDLPKGEAGDSLRSRLPQPLSGQPGGRIVVPVEFGPAVVQALAAWRAEASR